MTKPKDPKDYKKRGAPSKLEELDLEKVEYLAGMGMMDSQIAYIMGISPASLENYKKNPAFLEALKNGKTKPNLKAVESFYKRVCGYEVTETEAIRITTPEEIKKARDAGLEVKGVVLRVREYKRHIPPDTGAGIFFLKNRMKQEFRDRQDIGMDFGEGVKTLTVNVAFEPSGKLVEDKKGADDK